MSYTYSFTFSKSDEMIYISHLDLMRLLGRAVRRAELPVSLTHGFNPHFKLKLKKALKLGLASENEQGEFALDEKIESTDVRARLQGKLPAGIEIRDVKLLNSGLNKNLEV